MIFYPNAKINLGLNVTRKRTDGFHEIESVFFPIPWCDMLEVIPGKTGKGAVSFTSSGIGIPCNGKANLCEQVYQLLHNEFNLPSIKMHLHKIVPIGAGLGGGSADAAFTATMLNELFGLKMTEKKMENVVENVGSDCPFFIKNQTSFVTGRGEVLGNFDVNLSDYWMVIVNPNIHIGTEEAYAAIVPTQPETSLKSLLRKPVSEWKNTVKNDFEESVFGSYPAIPKLKEHLYSLGAAYASMTGSGSTVFGLFSAEPANLNLSKEFVVKVVKL